MPQKLFGTTGIRGLANDLLTPEFCSKVASAFGCYLKEIGAKNKKILVAMDTRTSSEMIKNSVISGLVSVGFDVFDAKIAPTPAVQYSVANGFDGGVMITGSHIPPDRNGMKFFMSDGTEVYGYIEEAIEGIFFSDKIKRSNWKEIGRVFEWDINKAYKEMLVKNGMKGNLKVIVDPGHGTQCLIMPYVLQELGYEVLTINSQIDGFFPGREPEPNLKNLGDLISIMKELDYDIGVAFDCDGDRAIFIDNEGNYLMGDVTGCIIADNLLEKGDTLVTTISTSSLIDYVAEKKGIEVVKTKVGAADVVAESKKKKAKYSFEENGGCIFMDINPARDGGLTTVIMTKIILKKNKKFSEILKEYPKFYQIKEKISCPDNLKQKLTEKIKEIYKKDHRVRKIDETDGVKVFLDDGWILFRASWTEPIFRIFVEAKSKKKADELMDEGKKIDKILKNM